MDIKKYVRKVIKEHQEKLILYRGVESEDEHPTDDNYTFFAKEKRFAEDYGDYIWECTFKPLNLFVSYTLESLQELYNEGFVLTDTYIEDMWDINGEEYKEYYDKNIGYKSAEHAYKSPYAGSDTWEMIEGSYGVLDYIISKYDGVVLLEGGELTYYIDTSKILYCELV